MKVNVILLGVSLLLAGCERPPEGVSQSTNENFTVGRLFTTDGCTVYRFVDSGRHLYFSKCDGAIQSSTFGVRQEACGKNCTQSTHDSINTN